MPTGAALRVAGVMSKVFANIMLSLDGYMARRNSSRHWENLDMKTVQVGNSSQRGSSIKILPLSSSSAPEGTPAQ
jgi:hypothetical protein